MDAAVSVEAVGEAKSEDPALTGISTLSLTTVCCGCPITATSSAGIERVVPETVPVGKFPTASIADGRFGVVWTAGVDLTFESGPAAMVCSVGIGF